MKPLVSVKELAKEAFSKHPVIIVLRQVKPNRATFTHGNLCGGACSNSISAGGLNELSMKLQLTLTLQFLERFVSVWLKGLQVFARLKPYGLSRRDVDFGTGTRVPADAGLPRLYGKYAEPAQLDPIVGLEGILHTIEDRIHRLFRFRLAYSCPLYDLIYKIEFNHWNLRFRLKPTTTICCTYF
jgi:hypothetical protein